MPLNLSAFDEKEKTGIKSNLNYSAFGVPKTSQIQSKPSFSFDFAQPQSIANSTPQINTTATPSTLVKETAQAVPRSFLSFVVDNYNAVTRKDPSKFIEKLTAEDFGVTTGFLEAVTGEREIKPLAFRIAEAELKVKAWQDLLPTSDNPNLSVKEKIVLDVLKNLDPQKLAFAGVVGGAGLDLSLFGGGEKVALKQLYKTITKESVEGNLLILGKRIGIADDLLPNFAKDGVLVKTTKEAEKLINNYVRLQQETKLSSTYAPVAERMTTENVKMRDVKVGDNLLFGGKVTNVEIIPNKGVIIMDTTGGKTMSMNWGDKIDISVSKSVSEKIFKTVDVQGNDVEQIFARKATTQEMKSPTAKSRGYNDIPDKEGYEKVFKPYGEEGAGYYYSKVIPQTEDATTQAKEILKNQLPILEGLSKLPIIKKKEITPVDRFIAEGKIRVKRDGNRDVYEYKKGDNWQRARDEDSAVKAVTPKEKPQKAVNPALEQLKTELEIRKDAFQEILGSGDNYRTAPSIEDAQKAVDEYVSARKAIKELELDIKEVSKMKPIVSKEVPVSPLSEAKGQSLEELAQQTLNTVDEPFAKKVASLDKMITDTNTPVKEKVNMLDYFRTPDRVLKKIGLGDVSAELRKSYDNYVAELPVHLQVITDWSKAVPKESNTKIFKYLDGQSIELTEQELKVAKEVREYLEDWALRLGLPEDNRITHYITHIFELGENAKEFDEDIARLIKDKVPGSVYDPFLEKRLGKKGYIEDTWQALDAYVKRAVRKSNMDPALEQMKRASVHLEDSQLNYVTRLGARINMRPTEWDNLLDNTIKQVVGYRFGQRPTAVISGTLRKMVYRGALGLNITSAIKNLTQGVNTFAKLGARDTLNGYIKLLRPGAMKELDESGVLRNGFIQDRTLSAVKQILQKADKGLFAMFELAERINRGSAYFGAKASAIRKGMTEEQAIESAKKLVRDTQFQFGAVDTPVAMQGDIAKTIFQFGSFSQKQTEFLTEMIKNKEFAGLLRYTLAAATVVYTVGETFNIKAKDFNPLNYFSRFGKPPSMALPISIFKAVTNMPDQYGKTPTTKAKIKDITYSGKVLIPAGIQLDKLFRGDIFGTKKDTGKNKGNSNLPKLPKLPKIKTNLPKLPKIKTSKSDIPSHLASVVNTVLGVNTAYASVIDPVSKNVISEDAYSLMTDQNFGFWDKLIYGKRIKFENKTIEQTGEWLHNKGQSIPGEFTSYNPISSQTDSSPRIMASGKEIYDGAIATSDYSMPLGTKIYIPELKSVFTVEDRMNRRYSPDKYGKIVFDIPTVTATEEDIKQSKEFGRKNLNFVIVGHDGRKETKEEK